jgi:GntR family transcriptional regulator, transcriptional repressor for pyruvate dehydrogenase complex
VGDEPAADRASADEGAQVWPRFAVLNRSTLPEEIATRLLALIRAKELRPGDKLPAERTLAAAMEVSRPVLREALRALAIMKVVDIRQGAGTYITSLEPQQLVSHLDFVFSKDTVALAQVLEARRVVEVGNVRLAALRADPRLIEQLEAIIAELRDALDDADRFSDLDIAFHNTVCAAAGNFLLGQFMGIINTLAKVSRERTGATRAFRERTLRDHEPVLEALRARDPGSAAQAMQVHLDHVEQALGNMPGVALEQTPPAGTPSS